MARKVWILGFAAPSSAFQQRRMSPGFVRARPVTETLADLVGDLLRTASKSPSEAMGKPASITSTFETFELPREKELVLHVHAEAREPAPHL